MKQIERQIITPKTNSCIFIIPKYFKKKLILFYDYIVSNRAYINFIKKTLSVLSFEKREQKSRKGHLKKHF